MSIAGQGPDIVQHADAAGTSLHAIALLSRETHPAQVICAVLGELQGMSRFLSETFTQLAQALVNREGSKTTGQGATDRVGGVGLPGGVGLAGGHLIRAAELAGQLGEELAKARDATIAAQGSKD